MDLLIETTQTWPLNLPSQRFLAFSGSTAVAWAVFDPIWYRITYASEAAHLADAPAEALLAFYFQRGQQLGHSPNMLFDEAWHRRAYPGIAAVVEAGRFPSAFDAYCRGGCLERSAHWLFDETTYRSAYPDLSDSALAAGGLVNGYDHYLWRGNAQGRIAHRLFDPSVYLAQLPQAEAEKAAADGPFWHYLRQLHARAAEVRTSVYFDPVWYCNRYPHVADAIARGIWRSALEHYLCNDTPTGFDPNPAFSEAYYLARGHDVTAMVQNGAYRNGYAHFLRHGAAACLSPSEPVDLGWYAEQPTVRQDLEQGLATDAFAHWLTIGEPKGLRSAPSREESVTESQARSLFRNRARSLSVLTARSKLDFRPAGLPALSVIMVMHDQFTLTMMALGSLRANTNSAIELILVDSGSTDETRFIERYVHGAIHLRFDTNVGYLRGCNAALALATAEVVLYLNNDIELAAGAVTAALGRLDTDPQIGAVGGLILRTHNLIQEAGNIIWRDGSTEGYLRDASPLAPEANFVRDVDFCSGAFLMTRRALLDQLEGFDQAFAPAYYEDADLCRRIAEAGYRVVYDPGVVVSHLEYGSARSSRAAEAEIGRARQIFVAKHAAWLANRPGRGEVAKLFARTAGTAQRRVLFFEDTVPMRMIGSGFVRSNDVVSMMASIGYSVTVYPLNGCLFDPAHVYADMPDTVEVMHDHALQHLPRFLAQRQGYYDVIWIARTHNLDTIRPFLEQTAMAPRPLIVLDTEAITSIREGAQAALDNRAFDLDAAVRHELRNAAYADRFVAVTNGEAALLRSFGLAEVTVLGHMRALRPTPRRFAERSGMLFVGAIHRMDSPNYDSLRWFIDAVMPLIEQQLGWQTRLTVAGYIGDEVTLDGFREHPRVTLCRTVADLVPLYDQHRVFVAPTRFAAGTPYKVHEAASFGLPVVATTLLRQQLGWSHGQELLSADCADPASFARMVVNLQRDETLWQHVRQRALERLGQENSRAAYCDAIASVVGSSTVGAPNTDAISNLSEK